MLDLGEFLNLEYAPLLFLGVAIAFGFLLGKASHLVKLTAIVGYIVVGILLGPVLGMVELNEHLSEIIINLTLASVAFIIGSGFTRSFVVRMGVTAVKVTIVQSLLTFLVVAVAVFCVYYYQNGMEDIKLALAVAIVFGTLGLATAPAGTIATLHEVRARGAINRITIGVVGLDDAVAVLIFVIGLACVKLILEGGFDHLPILEAVFVELLLAIALGIVFGLGLGFLTKVLRDREDMFIVSFGLILLCAGIADYFGASLIMACIVMGISFVNIAPREGKVIHSNIEHFIPIIFVVFFVTAGLELKLNLLWKMGLLGGVYVVARIIGKYFGAYLGCAISDTSKKVKKYLGFALLSQAGVAIGLAILVSHELGGIEAAKEIGVIAITVITATTVIFEIIGPLGVKLAVARVQPKPKTKEQKILKKMSKTADEVDVFNYQVVEDVCVYGECDEEVFVYDHSQGTKVVEDED